MRETAELGKEAAESTGCHVSMNRQVVLVVSSCVSAAAPLESRSPPFEADSAAFDFVSGARLMAGLTPLFIVSGPAGKGERESHWEYCIVYAWGLPDEGLDSHGVMGQS